MHKKGKIPALLLTVSILMTLFCSVGAAAASSGSAGLHNFKASQSYANNFADVAQTDWYYENVKTAYNYGLMYGTCKHHFNINSNITLAETLALACRLHSIYHTGEDSFVQSGPTWYQVYVDYAKANNLLPRSYSDYDRTATRAEFAEILSAAFPDAALQPINTIAANAIPDVSSNASAAPAIYRLYRAGILTGSDASGTFYPNSTILRVEAAAIVTRMAISDLRQNITLSSNADATPLGKLRPMYSNTIHYFTYQSESPFRDNCGNEYSNSYCIVGKGSGATPEGSAVYYVNHQYTTLSGTVVLSQSHKNAERAGWIHIYGDDNLLFDSGDIVKGAKPISFSLAIGQYEQLKIVSQDAYSTSYLNGWVRPYLVDLYLS